MRTVILLLLFATNLFAAEATKPVDGIQLTEVQKLRIQLAQEKQKTAQLEAQLYRVSVDLLRTQAALGEAQAGQQRQQVQETAKAVEDAISLAKKENNWSDEYVVDQKTLTVTKIEKKEADKK